ncbi:MAG TPA: MarR family winged helix-turn-helix transcriptional regulator [Haliangiales bacterium]|nr:MarR family winged helix-turn-helix transcriptional regulator [Haliangiales bacterium]
MKAPPARPAPVEETGFLLQRAHRRLRAALNEALRPLDLQIAHVAVLGLLAARGDLSQRQLIDVMDADKSSMVYLIDELERQGLAERRPDPRDRRAHAVRLTDAGRTRLVEAGRIVRAVEEEVLAPLSARERALLDDLLRRIGESRGR